MKLFLHRSKGYNETVTQYRLGLDLMPAIKIIGKKDKTEEERRALKSLRKVFVANAIVFTLILVMMLIAILSALAIPNEPKPLIAIVVALIGVILIIALSMASLMYYGREYSEWSSKDLK